MAKAKFVGRVGEFAALTELLELPAGVSGIALVSGEPGIGKTSLLGELGRLATTRGWSVLRARATDQDGAPPFWIWRQVVRAWLADADEQHVATHRAALTPILGDEPRNATPVTPEQRFAVFDGFAGFLTAIGRHLVLLDDLQWADDGSLALLRHLVEHQVGAVVIAAGARSVELGDRTGGTELRSTIARHGTHIELEGLSTNEVGAQLTGLLGHRPDQAVIDGIRQRTRGNPLFVHEVARAGLPSDDTVPDLIRDAIRHHLARLAPDCRHLLTVAAVIGGDLDVPAVAALTATPVDVLLGHLDRALAAGVVARNDAGWEFRHDLFRETLLHDLPLAEHAALHLRIAEHREEFRPVRTAEIARHRLAALPLGDPARASAAAQTAAAAAVAAFAFEDAADLYDQAVATAPDQLPLGDRCRLLIDAGRSRFLAGDQQGAIAGCTEAAVLAGRNGDAASLGAAALALPELPEATWVSNVRGWCEQALAGLPAEDSPLRAKLLAQQSLSLVLGTEQERVIAISAEALVMAERLDDDAALKIALRARQVALSTPHGHVDRLDLGDRLLTLGMRTGDLDAVLWGHMWRFDAFVQAGDVVAATSEIAELEPVVARTPHSVARWQVVRSRAALEIAAGHFPVARPLAAEAGRLVPPSPLRGAFWLPQAMLLSRLTGDEFDPRGAVPELVVHPIGRISLFIHFAPWHLAFGRRTEAAELYDALPDVRSTRVPAYMSLLVTALRGSVAAALDDPDGAAYAYEQLLPHADLHTTTGAGLLITLGSVQYFLGLTAAEIDTAVDHLTAAVTENERVGFAPYAALARFRLAELLRDRGRPGDHATATRMARAVTIAAGRLGMELLHRDGLELEATLRDREPAGPLTPRQREVAELVAQGRTNKEIAATLHIAERTAENHIQSILQTLGFRTRSQIATWATERARSG